MPDLKHLIELCRQKKLTIEILKEDWDKKVIVTGIDQKNNTLLHYVCQYDPDNVDLLNFLTDQGASLSAVGQFNLTPAVYLCRSASVNVDNVRILLMNGVNPNLPDKFGRTILHYLCENNAVTSDILQLFFTQPSKQKDTNFKEKETGQKPLENFHLDPCVCTKKNRAALHLLCMNKNVNSNMLQLFIDNGADLDNLDDNENSPLHLLCQNEHVNKDMLNVFYLKNADFCCENDKEKTPLAYLFENKKSSLDCRMLTLQYLCKSKRLKSYMLKQLFQERKFDLNSCDDAGKTLLHYICEYNPENTSVIDWLLEEKSELNIVDNDKRTPLNYLCRQGSSKNKINASRWLLLTQLCIKKLITQETINDLLLNNINLNDKNDCEQSLLHLVCEYQPENTSVIKLLLENGVAPHEKVNIFATPLSILCEHASNSVAIKESRMLILKYLCMNKLFTYIDVCLLEEKNINFNDQDYDGKMLQDYVKTYCPTAFALQRAIEKCSKEVENENNPILMNVMENPKKTKNMSEPFTFKDQNITFHQKNVIKDGVIKQPNYSSLQNSWN